MSADRHLRWGVIGAGWFASRRHLPDIRLHPECRLEALCRRDPDALDRLCREFGVENRFTDWRRMLEECPLDVVLIATPHHLHFEPARAALERGLHVLLEKPMTLHSHEAWELHALAEARGLKLGVALNPPFWAHCHRTRAALRDGEIGALEAISFLHTVDSAYVFGEGPPPPALPGVVPPTMYRSDPALCGGGVFVDSGSHHISEILWVTDMRVTAVTCLMDSLPSDRTCALALRLENGVLASVLQDGKSRFSSRRLSKTYTGSGGMLIIEGFDFQGRIESEQRASFREKELPAVPGPVANMVDALRGRSRLLSASDHGAHVVEVLEAAYRSAAEGRTVSLSSA